MAVQDPYSRGNLVFNAYASKVPLIAEVVVVLRGSLEDRDLQLIPQPSRAVCKGDVHELIITDEQKGPGSRVFRVAYIGFVEFKNGGVLLSGDRVYFDGKPAGHIAGYDLSHYPNHMNLVITGDFRSGEARGLSLGTKVVFEMVPD